MSMELFIIHCMLIKCACLLLQLNWIQACNYISGLNVSPPGSAIFRLQCCSSSCWSIVDTGPCFFFWLLSKMGGDCVFVFNSPFDWFDLFLMLKFMALPTLVVAIQIVATYSRYMRSSLLDVLNSDYMRTARSKGISERRVLIKHGVRNALIPVVTIAALDFGSIVGGLIITENIFSYPGMGLYFLKSFGDGDFPLLMPWMVVIVASVLLFNLIVTVYVQ